MLSHGVISSALFLCVGVIYDRMHTREIARYGGLARRMPAYATVFMVFMLGAVGLPGTSGFVGEFLVLLGTFQVDRLATVLATTGIILGAAYMLWLYRCIIFGPLEKEDLKSILDLGAREIAVFTPMVLVVLWMGIYPASFLDSMAASVQALVDHMETAAGPHATGLASLLGR
jgi:NADH-quinone oxidoreductase subunit M